MTKINLVHVPYKSSAAATTDLLGGHVQLSFQYAPTAMPHVKSGRVRTLGVASLKRTQVAPELPTIAESGLPGFEVLGWNGIHLPLATPRALVERISRDAQAMVKSPDVRERLLTVGMDADGSTPEVFAAFVKRDLARMTQLIRETGIRSQ